MYARLRQVGTTVFQIEFPSEEKLSSSYSIKVDEEYNANSMLSSTIFTPEELEDYVSINITKISDINSSNQAQIDLNGLETTHIGVKPSDGSVRVFELSADFQKEDPAPIPTESNLKLFRGKKSHNIYIKVNDFDQDYYSVTYRGYILIDGEPVAILGGFNDVLPIDLRGTYNTTGPVFNKIWPIKDEYLKPVDKVKAILVIELGQTVKSFDIEYGGSSVISSTEIEEIDDE